MSGAQLDQIAPREVAASTAAIASGMFGMYETARSPRPTPSRPSVAASAPACAASAPQDTSLRATISDENTIAGRSAQPGSAARHSIWSA